MRLYPGGKKAKNTIGDDPKNANIGSSNGVTNKSKGKSSEQVRIDMSKSEMGFFLSELSKAQAEPLPKKPPVTKEQRDEALRIIERDYSDLVEKANLDIER